MSSDKITLNLEKRDVVRKGLNHLRSDGKIPAVIHEPGKDSLHVQGDSLTLDKVYARAGKHHAIDIDLGGKDYLTLIKDVDIEPTKQKLRHVVFQSIKRNEKVQTEIPLVLEDNSPAEKNSLMVIKSLDTVEVEALPSDLVDELVVTTEKLVEVGDRLTVADIPVPNGMTILNDPDQGVAHVEMPKDQIAEADAAAADLAADAESTGDEPDQAEAGAEAANEAETKENSEEE